MCRAQDLRLQLLEPEKFPHLYKCLYGLLMLLPQSSAFAALKNRLNAVSSIGYLHIAPKVSTYDRPNRLKSREDSIIRWNELLEKFRTVQERARRAQRHSGDVDDGRSSLGVADLRLGDGLETKGPKEARNPSGPPVPIKDPLPPAVPPAVKRSGLGMRQIRNLGGAVRGKRPG
ncbi:protein VAC14 [Colletotrichum spaethianum]|uniref:Protein VAC14 n=1 Tax=Colletotrichum spaethianum TaxID=700344 RepID=A0AA37L8Q7_9PEZI|nr:protein VAC14 [Colletotrichum spaethianum]GKT39912.1 protein VAC14 [Colletotrichum spaethianum]